MRILYVATLVISVLSAWMLSLLSFLPSNNPFFFISFFVGISVIMIILKDWKNGHRTRKFFLNCTVTFTLIGLALGFNQLRYSSFSKSYTSGDTPFSMAAQKVMPALSLFDEAEAVEHYHGQKYGDEWIALKVTLQDDQYEVFVKSTKEKYTFYEDARIYDAVFCPCDNPILIDDYEFHIVDLTNDMDNMQQKYATAIAMNEADHSITYLFIDSFSFPFMSLDGVIRSIWPYIGVEL